MYMENKNKINCKSVNYDRVSLLNVIHFISVTKETLKKKKK